MNADGPSIEVALQAVRLFKGNSLRSRISSLESAFREKDGDTVSLALDAQGISSALLQGALILKQASAQIDEVVHSLGILISLPHILEHDEVIEYLSLGAGNTGRAFDLETNCRVAEFKFIDWKGNDALRQDSLFKDFYELAEYDTRKRKCLYVVGLDLPIKFLQGRRACESVLKRHRKTWEHFDPLYGSRHATVGSYFRYRRDEVEILDFGELIPDLVT